MDEKQIKLITIDVDKVAYDAAYKNGYDDAKKESESEIEKLHNDIEWLENKIKLLMKKG